MSLKLSIMHKRLSLLILLVFCFAGNSLAKQTYTPSDVIDGIYLKNVGVIDFYIEPYSNKLPTDVYQELFKLYYKLNRINGKSKISPSELYSHIYRAKEDLQYSLLTLSKQLNESEEEKNGF